MAVKMEKLVSLCKRRGYIYPSSEIYGGVSGCWDYGPMGTELKRNVKEFWWKYMVRDRENVVGMDSSIIMHPEVWKASGHVESFADPMVDCTKCKKRFRADEAEGGKCPECGGRLTDVRSFNLMFKTYLGVVEDEASVVYLRPETCQGIFVQFLNVLNDSRQKIPFGIAQIGKSFRNEVNPRNFIFRSREFEQLEMEFFVSPDDGDKWFQYWVDERLKWYSELGINQKKLRFEEHPQKELAHYAKKAGDIMYEFPFGWKELEGVHDRTDFDLSRHSEFSGKNFTYKDDLTGKSYVPNVIETSAGVDRTLLAILVDAYAEEDEPERTVLRLSPIVAPVKVAVFPLLRRSPLKEKAREIEKTLRAHFTTFYDEVGAIGRLYRRQDEVGTPCCVTVDHQTFEDNTVTLRDRDTLEQIRVSVDNIVEEVRKFLEELTRKLVEKNLK